MIRKKVVMVLILTIVCLALLMMTSCNPLGDGKAAVSQQLFKAERGDLTVSVTGSGKIETSHEARLAFGTTGKLEEILVEEGDRVSKGDMLAKLDTRALELSFTQAQVSLTQAKVALAQAQLTQKTEEYNLKKTRDSEDALKLALFKAEIDAETAKYNLGKSQDLYIWSDIKIAQADADEAERYVEDTMGMLGRYDPGTPGYESWQDILLHAQSRLNAAKDRLEAMMSGRDIAEVAIKKLQVESAQRSVAQAQKKLDELVDDIKIQELEVESAGQSLVQAEQSVELARQSLDEAQRQLDEATIFATFNGTVARVLAEEGDNIPSPSMTPQAIIHLIDPAHMKLVIEVDEIDIPLVQLNQEAVIDVDALPGVKFKGAVGAIHPMSREEGGVVLYDVKITLEIPENSGIRVGMSASADIVITKHSNVLVIPSRAIRQDGEGKTMVRVMNNGQVQERVVVVGLDDGLRTEVLNGLVEGEAVVVESRAKAASGSMF